VVERCEHRAAAHRDGEPGQSVVLEAEIAGHAALDLAAAHEAAAERHALQVARQAVAPLMVRADQCSAIAVALAAERHAAMRAHVLDHVERAIAVAGQDHRALADRRALEVARPGNLGLETDVAPVAAVEQPLELAAIDRFVGVGRERDPAARG
jgi:hypothetical protein